jgi:hypothetical protein
VAPDVMAMHQARADNRARQFPFPQAVINVLNTAAAPFGVISNLRHFSVGNFTISRAPCGSG